MNKTKEALIEKLYSIWDNRDFVLGVISPLDEEFEMKQVLNYIEANEDVTPSELLLVALSIDKDRGKDFIIETDFTKEMIRKD